MESVEELLAKAEADVNSLNISSEEFDRRTRTVDRSRIAKLIVWLFIIVIGATVVFVIGGVFVDYATNCILCQASWKSGAVLIKDILTSVLLPVVTLVIGFYFGVEKKS